MLLNLAIFLFFGAICPWNTFLHNSVIPIYRLIPLGILILLLRRLPIVFSLHKHIHQIEEKRQAIFVGFFGPIGEFEPLIHVDVVLVESKDTRLSL